MLEPFVTFIVLNGEKISSATTQQMSKHDTLFLGDSQIHISVAICKMNKLKVINVKIESIDLIINNSSTVY